MSRLKNRMGHPMTFVQLWIPLALATFVFLTMLTGTRADDPCPSGQWGPTCEGRCHCALKTAVCRSADGHCLNGGCSRGYTGAPSCQHPCAAGTFGMGCGMVCHCATGDVCNPVNGGCPSDQCQVGYDGAGCQIRLPFFSSPPNIASVTTHQALVTWRPWSSSLDTGDGPVGEYHLQYKGDAFPWTTYDVITVTSLPEPTSYSRLVTGLVALETYEFRVSLARSDDGKVGAPFPAPRSTSIKACNAPSQAVTDFSAVQELEGTDQVRITLNWKNPASSTSGCSSIESHQVTLQCVNNACTPTVTSVPVPQETYTFSRLQADTTKQLEVAPVNDVGQLGPSASLVAMALTAATSTPTVPTVVASSTSATGSINNGLGQGVISLSTTENSMEVTWPDVSASKYKIILMINESYSMPELKGQIQQQITLAGTYLLVHSLHAATRYNITVSPNSGAAAVHLLVWTNPLQPPAPPKSAILRVTSQSATLYIKPLKITTGPLTAYQVVMEYTTLSLAQQAHNERVRRKRTLEEDNKFQNLKGFVESKQEGLPYYMTAELTGSTLGAGINFTIGDGREYNGYSNAPLEEKTKYTVWIGLISTLAGVTKRTFVNVQGNTYDGSTFSTPANNPEVGTVASMDKSVTGLAVGLFFLFLMLSIAGIFIFCLWSRGWENVCPSYLLEWWTNNRIIRRRRINRNQHRLFDLFQNEQKPAGNIKSEGSVFKRTGPISTDDFVKDYEITSQYKKNTLAAEFQKLPRGLTSTAYVGTSVQNLHLNRNIQTVAYDLNRLCMVTQSKGENDYINATLMRGTNEKSYVVTQSPLPITISHFWRVVWDYRICHVVMLFDLEEQCSVTIPKYWPKEGQSQKYGQIEVKLVKEEKYAFYSVRSFELRLDSQNEVRYVRQFQYTDWQQTTGIPNGVMPFLDFIQRCHRNSETSDICLVHCQNGGGRSGLFVAIEALLEQAKQSGRVDILSCVTRLCMERPGLMKGLSQYHFMHQALFHALSYKKSVVTRKDFIAYLDNLNYVAVGNKTCMQLEFEKMMRLTPSSANEEDDRFQSPAKVSESTFKASATKPGFPITLVDSYKQRGHYLLMEHPSESKVSSFWRNVHTLACSCVVRLSDPDESLYQFIPDAGLEKQYGNLIVQHNFTINHSELLLERNITLKHASNKENTSPMTVILFHLYWRDDKSTPNVRAMLDLWRRVRFLTQSRTGKVAVVSGRAFSRSGLFCSTSVLLDKMEREGEANVYQFIKHMRTQVPEAVSTLEQYKFCYRVIKEYLRQTEQALDTSQDLSATISTHPFKSPYQVRTSTPKHRSPAKTPGQYPLLNMNKMMKAGLMVDMGNAPVSRSPARSGYAELSQPASTSSSGKSLRGSGEEPTSRRDRPTKQHRENTSCNESPIKLHINDLAAELDLSPHSQEKQWQEVLREAARLRNEKIPGQIDDTFLPVSERIQQESLLYEDDEVDTPKAKTLPSPLINRIAPEKPSRLTLDSRPLAKEGRSTSPKKAKPNSSKTKESSQSKKRKARLQQIGRALPNVGGYNS